MSYSQVVIIIYFRGHKWWVTR